VSVTNCIGLTGCRGQHGTMAAIYPEESLSELKMLAERYPIFIENIFLVPNVQDWCQDHGIECKRSVLAAYAARNPDTGTYSMVMSEEISDDEQFSIRGNVEYRGFFDDLERIDSERAFLHHLFLREIAHCLLLDPTEDNCDVWAFEELDKFGA